MPPFYLCGQRIITTDQVVLQCDILISKYEVINWKALSLICGCCATGTLGTDEVFDDILVRAGGSSESCNSKVYSSSEQLCVMV